MKLRGIHHITAIASDPQRNLDFYTHVLGLRLVKRTINFDDPGSYHFYFGDEIGTPGTIITFFPWPGARRGTRGNSQIVAVSFAVARSSFPFWKERFARAKTFCEQTSTRFGEEVLRLADSDGLLLELIGSDSTAGENAIAGFAAPTLQVQEPSATEKLLRETLGFEFLEEEGSRRRFSLDPKSPAAYLDLVTRPDDSFGHIAAGTVHHIAFRCASDEEQLRWREKIVDLGLQVSPVMDRQYFHSIYFREPNGILFEIATDGPGFMIDEAKENLGSELKLPKNLEPQRAAIEAMLLPVELRKWSG